MVKIISLFIYKDMKFLYRISKESLNYLCDYDCDHDHFADVDVGVDGNGHNREYVYVWNGYDSYLVS